MHLAILKHMSWHLVTVKCTYPSGGIHLMRLPAVAVLRCSSKLYEFLAYLDGGGKDTTVIRHKVIMQYPEGLG